MSEIEEERELDAEYIDLMADELLLFYINKQAVDHEIGKIEQKMLSLESLRDDPNLIRVILNLFHRGFEKNQNQYHKKIKSCHEKIDVILHRIQLQLALVFSDLKHIFENYEKVFTLNSSTDSPTKGKDMVTIKDKRE